MFFTTKKLKTIIIIVFLFSTNIISQPSLTLTTPNGGEVFNSGNRYGISWISNDIDRINISYSIDNGLSWKILYENISTELNVVGWKIPNIENNNVVLKIEDINSNVFDISDTYFTITRQNRLLSKTTSTNSAVKILPLGNSITYDNRSSYGGITPDPRTVNQRTGYRLPLYSLLTNAGYSFDFIGSEKAGGDFLPDEYTDNAGFPGIRDDQLAYLLQTGRLVMPFYGVNDTITNGPYLNTYSPDIILLHIGTNGNDAADGTDPSDVEAILDEVDWYEETSGNNVTVIVAKIIDRVPNASYVTSFNSNIDTMIFDRVNNPLNDAYPDDIIIVDMQNGANLDYTLSEDPNGLSGDMNDALHPNNAGYSKMAQVWFDSLVTILPEDFPQIVNQPSNITVLSGSSAEFKVSASSVSSMSFQWYKNDNLISGATDSVFVLSSTSNDDDSTFYFCTISNNFGMVSSDTVLLEIIKDDERVSKGLEILYNFTESEGTTIFDISESEEQINLTISDTSNVEWSHESLSILDKALIFSDSIPSEFYNSLTSSNEFSIEVWLNPQSTTQTGPARIISYSEDGNNRNFTLGQEGSSYVVRIRTTETDLNGLPQISTEENSVELKLTHLVFNRDSLGVCKLFIDGEEVVSEERAGTLENWNSDYLISLSNEFNSSDVNRFWLGKYYLAAFYSTALSTEEVIHNYNVGVENEFSKILAPSNLSGQLISNTTNIQLNWTDNSSIESGYIIERKVNDIDSTFYEIGFSEENSTSFIDSVLKISSSYIYRTRAYTQNNYSDFSNEFEIDSITTSVETENLLSNEFHLFQNYPNPFNPSTNIRYNIGGTSNVKLEVYNIIGQKVGSLVNKELHQGSYQIKFNANNLAAGVYTLVLRAKSIEKNANFFQTRKILLLK